MKTLRRLLAVALLVGSYHVGIAQNTTIPQFNTEAEKQTWIDANPEKYAAMQPELTVTKQEANSSATSKAVGSQSAVRLLDPVRVDIEKAKATSAPAAKVRVNNTVNAVPADYKAPSNDTKSEQK